MMKVPPTNHPPHQDRDAVAVVRVPTVCPARVRFVIVELVRIAEWTHSHGPTVEDHDRHRSMRDAGLACRLAAELLHEGVLRPWSVMESRATDEDRDGTSAELSR